MVESMWNLALTLRGLTVVRTLVAVGNAGLNLVAVHDLVEALIRTSPGAALVAVAWLIPWYRLVAPVMRRWSPVRSVGLVRGTLLNGARRPVVVAGE